MEVPQVDPREAWEALQRGDAVLLDVREPEEWDEAHVAGSRHVPLGELALRLDEVPPGSALVVVCRSGARSDAVARALLERGRRDVANLHGGLLHWQALGLPLEPRGGRVH